jgi:hypothetical protein
LACFGDGTGTNCPCGNNGAAFRGCANSVNSNGARLVFSGTASTQDDSLHLTVSGMPLTTTCLFFQGTTISPSGFVFGDGLRCASGATVRLAIKTASSGIAAYPTGTDPDIHVRGLVPADGGFRSYQVWYRNAASFCTASTFNLSNGMTVWWAR